MCGVGWVIESGLRKRKRSAICHMKRLKLQPSRATLFFGWGSRAVSAVALLIWLIGRSDREADRSLI